MFFFTVRYMCCDLLASTMSATTLKHCLLNSLQLPCSLVIPCHLVSLSKTCVSLSFLVLEAEDDRER